MTEELQHIVDETTDQPAAGNQNESSGLFLTSLLTVTSSV